MTKSEQLAEDFGYESTMECIEDTQHDGTMPGICTNAGCDYSTEVEPDQSEGYCEGCGAGTVSSIMILEGLI